MIRIIAAVTRDMGLGRAGDLLYHISADLKRFKELTMGGAIVMGRKTFESFPKGALPGRRNMVVTSDRNYRAPGIETFGSLDEALEMSGRDCYVIGGGMIYRESMPIADELYLTEIDADSEDADTFFPDVDLSVWERAELSERMVDPRSGAGYRFARYVRKMSKGS